MYKKIVSGFLLSLMFIPFSFASNYQETEVEHLNTTDYKISPKVDLVKITSGGNVIQKENLLVVNFAQNFNSKYYKQGDYVQFNFDNDIRTKEGTLLIPCNSSLIARISCIENPKWFSRNAKVYLEFTHILLSDSTNIPVALQIAKKKKYLQEGAKETAGKIAGYTLAIGGVGSGLGAAIGVAAGHTITGLIIGGSIGGGVGLVSGVVSPGLHFRAKKGEKLILELQDNLKLPCQ
ncbi:MAG: hypothetical protein IJ877_00020 [Candidatus Gastranaerophilales bacterium]|nr:hypothetical protein [Candidatus Gastranaerophilales bacterium]